MKQSTAIVQALSRLAPDPLLLHAVFEAVHSAKKDDDIRVPPHLVERLGEECLLAWGSTDEEQLLDPVVAKVIRGIPWKRGQIPDVVIVPKK